MKDSIINIYDEKLNGIELTRKLSNYHDACRYCHDDIWINWRRVNGKADINDWV